MISIPLVNLLLHLLVEICSYEADLASIDMQLEKRENCCQPFQMFVDILWPTQVNICLVPLNHCESKDNVLFSAGPAFLEIVVLIEFALSFPKVELIVMVPVEYILGLIYWQFVLFKFSKALVAMVCSFTIHVIVCHFSQSVVLFLKTFIKLARGLPISN